MADFLGLLTEEIRCQITFLTFVALHVLWVCSNIE